MKRVVAALIVAVALAGCASGEPSAGTGHNGSGIAIVHASEMKPWPLTVKSGELKCQEEISHGFVEQVVTFKAPDGTVYGINGTALDDGYKDFKHTIWKHAPSGHGLMVDVGGLIGRGLRLCEGK